MLAYAIYRSEKLERELGALRAELRYVCVFTASLTTSFTARVTTASSVTTASLGDADTRVPPHIKKKREEALALTHARTHAAKFEDALTHARTHAAKFEDVAAKLERELKQLVEAKKESDAALERARALVLSLLALLVR